jgi:small GTP-binding protein
MDDLVDLECDLSFKVVLVGDVFVGKTSLLDRFQSRELCAKYPDAKLPRPPPTVGLSSRQEIVEIRGMDVILAIWDTAGQER